MHVSYFSVKLWKMSERVVFSRNEMGITALSTSRKKKNTGLYLTTYTKTKYKVIVDLNQEIIHKTLREHLEINLSDFGVSNDVLDMILKAQTTKERTDKRLHQIRDFPINGINKDKRQRTIWEKIFTSYFSVKGLVFSIY